MPETLSWKPTRCPNCKPYCVLSTSIGVGPDKGPTAGKLKSAKEDVAPTNERRPVETEDLLWDEQKGRALPYEQSKCSAL